MFGNIGVTLFFCFCVCVVGGKCPNWVGMVMHAYLMFKFLNLLLKMLDDHNKHNFFWVFHK